MGVVVVEDGTIAVAQTEAGGGFPAVSEAVHLMEFGRAAVGDEKPEEATSFDGTELAVIPDQDQLGVGCLHDLGQGGEVGGGDHGGLIDDQDLAAADPARGIGGPAAVVEKFGDGLGRDSGFLAEDPGSHG